MQSRPSIFKILFLLYPSQSKPQLLRKPTSQSSPSSINHSPSATDLNKIVSIAFINHLLHRHSQFVESSNFVSMAFLQSGYTCYEGDEDKIKKRKKDDGCWTRKRQGLFRVMTCQSVMHSEHRHELFFDEGRIFRCNGCYEHGVGNHYKCTHPNSSCIFHLHIACAEGPRKLEITLPLYGDQYVFDFRAKPVNKDRYCVACGKKIRRYNYHCPRKNLDLHPSCTADFPVKLTVNNIPLKLNKRSNGRCHHCHRSKYRGRNLDTWAYVSKSQKKQYFAGCLLDSQIRNCREALGRHGSAGGSQVGRTFSSQNGSQVSRNSSFTSQNGSEVCRNSSFSSHNGSQVSRNSSFSSQNGSTSGSHISRNQTPGLHEILGYIAPAANNISQAFTFITGWPFLQP